MNTMTQTTTTPADELEQGATFMFPEDEDHTLYVLEDSDWNARSAQPLILVYRELGAPTNEVYRTSHSPSEMVEVWP